MSEGIQTEDFDHATRWHETLRTSRNVNATERAICVAGGLGLGLYGMRRGSAGGYLTAGLGTALLLRGLSGYSPVYDAQRRKRDHQGAASTSVPYGEGIGVTSTVTVFKPRGELYSFWRKLENLPKIMEHLQSVTELDGKRSHWVSRGPAGKTLEWDAEIINEIPNELIGWRSLDGADVDNAGSVSFSDAPGGRGTVIRIELRYDPPGGKAGALIAKLFRESPSIQIPQELRRFKQLMESGEVATTDGQSSGRS